MSDAVALYAFIKLPDEGHWRPRLQRRGILAGIAPSIYHIPNFSPRLPHPSDVLRVERLSKEREADEEAVKAELEPSFGDPHRKASRVHFDSLGLDDHRLLLSITPYGSNATAP